MKNHGVIELRYREHISVVPAVPPAEPLLQGAGDEIYADNSAFIFLAGIILRSFFIFQRQTF